MMPPGDTPPQSAAWLELPDKSTHPLARDSYIGRVVGNEIVVPDHRVSRRHAVVQCQGRRFTIVDLGSTNGTLVNDTRIFRPTQLRDADVIVIGGQRFVFCQPVSPDDNTDDAAAGTAVIVGKTACWMLVVAVADPASVSAVEWATRAEQTLAKGGARLKRWRGASFLAHWRVEVASPAAIRSVVLELAGAPCPAGARLALHYGTVRVGAGAGPTEENLLGAAVTFTHQLEAAAAELGVGFLLSEEAANSLELAKMATRLGPRAVRGAPGMHVRFVL
ncbi:MAG: FHA domain-containing protein [Verrucomicrobia bacterium]|nr:FHA domain-containing protein [Verrucomicrobiota bacterium]